MESEGEREAGEKRGEETKRDDKMTQTGGREASASHIRSSRIGEKNVRRLADKKKLGGRSVTDTRPVSPAQFRFTKRAKR